MAEKFITITAEDQQRSNPKAGMVRAETRTMRGYANQRAHDLRIGPQPNYVVTDRTKLNRILMAPISAKEMKKKAEERRALKNPRRQMKSNAGVAVIGIIGFGTEAAEIFAKLSVEEQNQALLEVAKAVADEAKTSLEGLVWHADETAGHAHTAWCGYDFEGNPLSTTMKRGMLMRFQDRMAAIMNERAPGIERGRSKLDRLNAGANFAETVHLSVKQLHAKLPADIAAKEAELAELQNNIQGLIDREAEMQGRVDKTLQKLAATSDDEQRLSKRLSDYEKRLAERAAAVAAVEARMEHLNAEIRRHEKDARRAAERAAEREQQLRAIEGAENSSRASLAILEARRADLEAVVLQQTEALEVLKPLYAAARAVEFATTMTAEEEQAAWTEMMFTGQCDDALEHATAIRMCDPFFMPNVDRSRHPAPSDNLIYLHALKSDNPDAYRHLIESVSAEPNAGEAVEYLQAGALRVQNGKIRLLGLADKGPGVFERAIGWLRQAFEGVKRGFGIQRAQELGKALDPATIAEAGLFASFNEKQRAALLYAVQTKANPGRDVSAADRLETDLEISPGFR